MIENNPLSPFAKNWQDWIESENAKSCLQEGFIKRQYLENRLWHAFAAGQNSARENMIAFANYCLIESLLPGKIDDSDLDKWQVSNQ